MRLATRSTEPIYGAHLRCPPHEDLPDKDWEYAADWIEAKQNLSGHARIIVFHTSPDGWKHMHVVWNRIDPDTRLVKKEGYSHKKLKEAVREIEIFLGLSPAPRRKKEEAKPHVDAGFIRQVRRFGMELEEFRAHIGDIWKRSDSGKAFAVGLAESGLLLARGDKQDFVAVDRHGGVYSLPRLMGMRPDILRRRFADIDNARLGNVAEAEAMFARLGAAAPAQEPAKPAIILPAAVAEITAPQSKAPALIPAPASKLDIRAEWKREAAALLKNTRSAIRDAWRKTRTILGFVRKLSAQDMKLEHGIRDSYAVIDAQGVKHPLPRLLREKAADVRKKLGSLDSG
ncbi:MAG: relaxase/mobilization nuclease domain-containing protein [Alphaproteobacteria bacterium]